MLSGSPVALETEVEQEVSLLQITLLFQGSNRLLEGQHRLVQQRRARCVGRHHDRVRRAEYPVPADRVVASVAVHVARGNDGRVRVRR